MARYTLGEKLDESLYVLLKDGKPTNARASTRAAILDGAEVFGGVFRGGRFSGGEFHGGEFHGGWFYDGVFHRGVFHGGDFRDGWLPLQIQGSKHLVNIPDGKTIQIGCKNGTPAWWRAKYKTVGADQGYTEAQIAEYAEYIRLASTIIEANRTAGE